jgi:hypothetical protein
MAILQYRVQFQRQFLCFNGGDVAYFDGTTAARLVGEGIGTALDALPTSTPENPLLPDSAIITDAGLPIPATAADSSVLQSEAGLLGGS